jgi:hypothetical protein
MRATTILIFMLFCVSAFSQVRKVNAETSIQQVTIYSSGARVDRTAAVNIPVGRTEISFGGLSNQLEQQTVQLKAESDLVLLSVQTTKDFLTERKIEEQEREFIDKTNSLKDKLDLDQKMLDVYRNEEAMLIKNQAIGGQSGVKTTDLKEALEFQRQRLTEVYSKQLEIQKRIVSQQKDLERFKAQMREISKKRDSINFVVTALIDSKKAEMVNFHLLYNVKDAGWYPTYDVRVTDISKPLEMIMHANVFQRSGETWKNISLLLSSGNPKDNATSSQLQPWKLGLNDPSVRGMGIQGEISGRITDENGEPVASATISARNQMASAISDKNGYFKLQNMSKNTILYVSCVGYQPLEMMAEYGYLTIKLHQSGIALNEVATNGYAAPRPAGIQAAEMDKKVKMEAIHTVDFSTDYQPTAIVYEIHDKYTLETDGKTTTIGIKEMDLPAVYEYYAAPKIDPAAFLTAKITNWQDYDLQSGEASLYFEGTSLGKTYIDLSTMADTLSLSLGKDNAVKITRKLIKEFSGKQFIGSNKTDSRQYEISIHNSKRVPINITVVDQIPVSISKDIVVEDATAKEAKLDKETGIATWALALPPSQEKKVEISYHVKYPKDKYLVLD